MDPNRSYQGHSFDDPAATPRREPAPARDTAPISRMQVAAWREARRTPEHWLGRVARQARLLNRMHRLGRPADLLAPAEHVFQLTVRRAFDTGATLDEVARAAGLAVAR